MSSSFDKFFDRIFVSSLLLITNRKIKYELGKTVDDLGDHEVCSIHFVDFV